MHHLRAVPGQQVAGNSDMASATGKMERKCTHVVPHKYVTSNVFSEELEELQVALGGSHVEYSHPILVPLMWITDIIEDKILCHFHAAMLHSPHQRGTDFIVPAGLALAISDEVLDGGKMAALAGSVYCSGIILCPGHGVVLALTYQVFHHREMALKSSHVERCCSLPVGDLLLNIALFTEELDNLQAAFGCCKVKWTHQFVLGRFQASLPLMDQVLDNIDSPTPTSPQKWCPAREVLSGGGVWVALPLFDEVVKHTHSTTVSCMVNRSEPRPIHLLRILPPLRDNDTHQSYPVIAGNIVDES